MQFRYFTPSFNTEDANSSYFTSFYTVDDNIISVDCVKNKDWKLVLPTILEEEDGTEV